jgi:hypothetical protein
MLAFVWVAIVLVGAASACGAPSASLETTPTSPPAQATNVRRTAVAAVQRIIANNPDPTSTPSATATTSPTCNNAIWWREARLHVGESHQVQGTVVATRPAAGGMALLEIGQVYPDPTGLAVLVPASSASQFSGKTVCVGGRITTDEGKPTILVRDPSSIVVVKSGG